MANKTNKLFKRVRRAYGTVEYLLQKNRHAIIGVALMLFVASVAYSSVAIWFNISAAGVVPKIMVLPQIVTAAGIVVLKFTNK